MRFTIGEENQVQVRVIFTSRPLENGFFLGKWKEAFFTNQDGRFTLMIGLGEKVPDHNGIQQLTAKAMKECREKRIRKIGLDVSPLAVSYGTDSIFDMVQGALLGVYRPVSFAAEKKEEGEMEVFLTGIEGEQKELEEKLSESVVLAEAVSFARDLVNLPGNHLRPQELAKRITEQLKELPVEVTCYETEKLEEMGMGGLLAVGGSSAYPPILTVLKYTGDPDSREVIGLVGKGVTCDTGGYCLKSASSMPGIKGDMAGAAAVAAALYALAKNRKRTNVVAVMPLCENRISEGSFLPGDIITSYSGKTIEIINTDAEGRLILADAVSYTIRDEKATCVVDIATLTGAVVGMLGFTVAGAMSNDDSWYACLERAGKNSGERYWRIPYYEEHEKMLESELADLRNLSKDGCSTITAGLFIREFLEGKPWIHLDIAGTAWVDSPAFEFQTKGATGAGVSTLYHLCTEERIGK